MLFTQKDLLIFETKSGRMTLQESPAIGGYVSTILFSNRLLLSLDSISCPKRYTWRNRLEGYYHKLIVLRIYGVRYGQRLTGT